MSVLRVRAGSVEALAHAQGRATAGVLADRLEEDLAHVEATTGTAWDAFWRRTRLVGVAERSYEALDEETRGFLAAYGDGVRPELPGWRPWTPLAVLAMHHVLFGSLGHHLWRRHVARTLGPDAVRHLAQEVPALSGSNAWAVGGDRTASGRPMIGADPHRIVTVPGVYQRVHLVATDEDVDVVGLTFPGIPGVQHFGHTGTVAWAITNAMADVQDLVEVGVEVGGLSADGPVVLSSDDGVSLALRTAPFLTDDLGLGALLPLLRARTVPDVDAALDRWVDPVNDVLVADRDGAVLHRVAGRVPWRDADGAWTGWQVPFRREVGSDEHVVVANHRQGEHSRRVSGEFAPAHRALRLQQLLAGRDGLTVEDGAALHADTLLLPAGAWQRRVAKLALDDDVDPSVAVLRERVIAWDGRMDADSVDAGLFAAVRSATIRTLAADPVLAPLAVPSAESGVLFAPWLHLEPRLVLAVDRWLDEDDVPLDLDLDGALLSALHEVAPSLDAPVAWGDTHTFAPLCADPVPLSGDDGCVLSTASLVGVDDRVWRGPVARLVWCLDDRAASRWTVPDELDVWASGSTSPLEVP